MKKRYAQLVREIDGWFGSIRARYAGRMQCGRGCALCCHGLFDISLPDAAEVALAFDRLPSETRAAVTARAADIQAIIEGEAPDLRSPYLLHALPEERIDRIVENAGSPRCPFLGEHNECLIYDHRPLACRLEGVPMVDAQDGLFGDWCELNFTSGVPADAIDDLKLDYYHMQEVERAAIESISKSWFGKKLSETTVFIPSLIVEFERFWKSSHQLSAVSKKLRADS